MGGFLSTKLGVEIDQVAEKGQGLAFVVYPTALAYLPGAWVWAVLFFFMLFLLGLDSEFALLETALTAMYDGFPKMRSQDQDHCGRVRELLPPRTTLRLSLGAVRTRPNGHIRCRLRCSLDRL